MKEQPETDVVLRRFLLGKVNDEERQEIESLFITDPGFRERVLAAEQDLIEDYLEDGMTTADRVSFLSRYGETAEQRRKLRIARSIKEFAVATDVPQTKSPTKSLRKSWLSQLWLQPRLLVPTAAALLIAVVVIAFWLSHKTDHRDAQHLAVERELQSLNTAASLREFPPQMVLMVLPPVSLRNPGSQMEFAPRGDIRFVELRLLWIQKERPSRYQAVLRKVGGAEQFTIRDLQPDKDNEGAIRVRLPTSLLTRGLYQISLSGIGADGTADPAEEYTFSVGGQG